MRLLRCAMALGLAMALTAPYSATGTILKATPEEEASFLKCLKEIPVGSQKPAEDCIPARFRSKYIADEATPNPNANLELELLKIDNQARMELDAIKRQNSEFRTKVMRREMRDWRR